MVDIDFENIAFLVTALIAIILLIPLPQYSIQILPDWKRNRNMVEI